jgi:hypothetical protein
MSSSRILPRGYCPELNVACLAVASARQPRSQSCATVSIAPQIFREARIFRWQRPLGVTGEDELK